MCFKLYVSWHGYAGGYHSAYDLYDYDIYVNNAKIFNLKEKLGNETQTLLIDIGEYKLRAFYNEETKVFNAFQLEFVCTKDTIVTFENFKKKEKNIYVGQNVNDTRISKIEFSIISNGSAETPTWIELVGTNRRLQSVSCGDIIMFRLTTGREIVGTYEYKIAGASITGDALEGEVYQESNVNYTICKFMIGDIYFDNNIDCKLVSSAS